MNEPQIKEATTSNARIGKQYPSPISRVLTVESKRVTSQDIGKWKLAIQAAKSNIWPRRRLLYELYDSIVVDGHLESVMDKFIASVANKRLVFVPNKENEGMDVDSIMENVVNTPWFRDLIKYRMESKVWGHSLVELAFEGGIIVDANLINRLNVVPERGWLAMDYTNLEGSGIAYRADAYWSKYLVEFGKKKDLGKLLTAAQYVIYKRGGIGDYAQCVELFGMPFREARYNPFNPGDREKLDEAMSKAGAAGYAVIPDGSSITFHQTSVGTGAKDLYTGLIKEICNEELSKIFLGNTLTTSQGENGARSLGDVHKDAEDDLMLSHVIETEYDLNWNVKDVLLNHIPELAKGKFMFQESSDLPLTERINIDIQLFNSGAVEFPESYWYETYGIPQPDAKERKQQKEDEPDDDSSKKKTDEPTLKVVAEHSRSTESCCTDPRNHATQLPVVAAYTPDEAEEAFLKAVFDGEGNKYDYATFRKNATSLISELKDGLKPSFEYGGQDTVAYTMMEMNLYRFSFQKNLATTLELNAAAKANANFNDFRKEASTILGKFNENYLRTEHQMTHAVGQNARDYLRILETQDRFPYVRYRTVGDDAVRQSHAALDGRIWKVTDTSWRSFVPPNGYNCRCSLESVASADSAQVTTGSQAAKAMGTEFTQMKRDGFAVNRADLGIVFDLNKEYADTLKGVSKSIGGIGYKEGGLEPFAEIAKTAQPNLPTSSITLKDAQETFRAEQVGKGKDAYMVVSQDKDAFPVAMKFDALGKNQKYIQLFAELPDLLANYHELYMVSDSLLRYVQHYADGMFVADVALNNGKPTVDRWFTDTKDGIRKGLLLNKR